MPAEDIPAVTQVFTPHWRVPYRVENSLGRLWLLNRPTSWLRDETPYSIVDENNVPGSLPDDFLRIAKIEEISALAGGHGPEILHTK